MPFLIMILLYCSEENTEFCRELIKLLDTMPPAASHAVLSDFLLEQLQASVAKGLNPNPQGSFMKRISFILEKLDAEKSQQKQYPGSLQL